MRKLRKRSARKPKFNLRSFVLAEARKLQRESALSGEAVPSEKTKAEEVDADGYADSLEKDIDFIKALKIKEAKIQRQHVKLARQMKKLQETKRKLRNKIIKNI